MKEQIFLAGLKSSDIKRITLHVYCSEDYSVNHLSEIPNHAITPPYCYFICRALVTSLHSLFKTTSGLTDFFFYVKK